MNASTNASTNAAVNTDSRFTTQLWDEIFSLLTYEEGYSHFRKVAAAYCPLAKLPAEGTFYRKKKEYADQDFAFGEARDRVEVNSAGDVVIRGEEEIESFRQDAEGFRQDAEGSSPETSSVQKFGSLKSAEAFPLAKIWPREYLQEELAVILTEMANNAKFVQQGINGVGLAKLVRDAVQTSEGVVLNRLREEIKASEARMIAVMEAQTQVLLQYFEQGPTVADSKPAAESQAAVAKPTEPVKKKKALIYGCLPSQFEIISKHLPWNAPFKLEFVDMASPGTKPRGDVAICMNKFVHASGSAALARNVSGRVFNVTGVKAAVEVLETLTSQEIGLNPGEVVKQA